MHHDLSDLGALILTQITPQGRHPLLRCGTFVVCDSYKEIHVAWLDNPADSCMREV